MKIKLLLLLNVMIFISCSLKEKNFSEINIWHQMHYENRKVLREVCDKYEEKNPDTKINLTYRETEELRSNFQSASMGGSGPELIYGPSDQVGPFAIMGIIHPLDTLFEKSFFLEFDKNAIVEFQNRTWMIGDVLGNHLMLIYNKEIIEVPPSNTNELIKIGKQLTKDLNGDGQIDQYGLVWNFTEPFFYAPWLGGFGGWLMTEDHKPNLNTKENQKAFSFIKSLRDKYKIIPKECDYEIANAMFLNGEAAMIINGDWSWGNYLNKIDFGIARIPRVSETGLWPTPIVSTKGYSININTKDDKLKETKKLLRYLTSSEVQLHFTRKVNSQPTSYEAMNDPIVLENEILKQSAKIIKVGKPMSVVPEMRAIWDALRSQYQMVLGGSISPLEAANLSQKNALKQIELMNEVIEPKITKKSLKILFIVIILGLFIYVSKKRIGIMKLLKENKIAYLFLFPAFLIVFAVVIFPFFYNIVISFSNFSLKTFRDWDIIGFNHYLDVLSDSNFYYILFKTIIWTVVNLFFHAVIGISLALLINRTLPAKPLLRTLLIIPWAIPQYISALSWRGMFNQEYGSINILLSKLFNMNPIQWLSSPFEAFSACILTNIWLGFPFMMIIALGGLQSIPNDLYEAAEVDGASRLQKLRFITLPMIMPVMVPAIILGMIWTFNNINVVWLVSNGGEPADQTHILVSYVYKSAFNLYRYGYAAALSMIIFTILFFMGTFSIKKSNSTESLY